MARTKANPKKNPAPRRTRLTVGKAKAKDTKVKKLKRRYRPGAFHAASLHEKLLASLKPF